MRSLKMYKTIYKQIIRQFNKKIRMILEMAGRVIRGILWEIRGTSSVFGEILEYIFVIKKLCIHPEIWRNNWKTKRELS